MSKLAATPLPWQSLWERHWPGSLPLLIPSVLHRARDDAPHWGGRRGVTKAAPRCRHPILPPIPRRRLAIRRASCWHVLPTRLVLANVCVKHPHADAYVGVSRRLGRVDSRLGQAGRPGGRPWCCFNVGNRADNVRSPRVHTHAWPRHACGAAHACTDMLHGGLLCAAVGNDSHQEK